MKKTYISPSIHIVKVELTSPLMQISRSEAEINEANAGLVKGTSSSTPRYNVWDDDWSAQ